MNTPATPLFLRAWAKSALALALLCFTAGVAAQTYTNASTTYNWIDSTAHAKVGYLTAPYKLNGGGGCGTTPPTTDDSISDQIPIGFNFAYGASVYTQLQIQTNGRLQFANTTCGYGTQSIGPPQTYPNGYPVAAMNNTMKIFGVDLDPTNLVDVPNYPSAAKKTTCTSTATCYISYASTGTAPNRKFVVTWKAVPEWVSASTTSGSFDLQVILNEDGTFVYQYGTISHGGTGTAQVGWQLTTTDYQVLSFGASVEPGAGTAIIFYIPRPAAQYQFEEGAWASGVAGQVTDSTTNNRHGTALGAAQETASGYLCRGANIPNNTDAGTVDAIRTAISIPDPALNMIGTGTAMFWYKSTSAWSGGGAQASQLLDATEVNGQWFYLTKTASGTLYLQTTDSNGASFSVETAAQSFAANTWVHIAIVWNFNALAGANQDNLSILINAGTPTTASFTTNGTLSSQIGFIHLGDNPSGFAGTKGTVNSANGVIDEAQFFNYKMSQGQVNVAKGTTHPCSTYVIDHLEIQHGSWSGIACVPGTVTLRACQNASCSTLYTKGLVATLTATGGATTWVPAGDATVVIGNGQSSATKNFYVGSGTATLGGTSVPPNTNATTCNGASGSCVWTSSSSGLIITPPTAIIGGQPTAVTVQAVESVSGSPVAACTPAKNVAGAGLRLWSTPGAPASFPAPSGGVGGSPQVANASAGSYIYTPTAQPGSNNLTGLSFDANASTTVWVKHMDVGSWTLNARLDTTATTSYPALTMTGSNAAVTIPVGYGVAAATLNASAGTQTQCAGGPSVACDTSAGADSRKAAAGDLFSTTVTAALWAAASTDLANNLVAPSYAGNVALSPALVAPQGGGVGTLAVGTATLASGTATLANQRWTQSGALRIQASGTYLGNAITGQSAVLGRIVPHHFETVVTPACTTFTYSNQPITLVRVKAMDGVTPAGVATNYRGDFARNVTLSDTSGAAGALTSNTITAASFALGEATATPKFVFTLPQTAPATLMLRAVDSDTTPVSSSGYAEGTTGLRSGRLWMSNAYGSELLPLSVPVQAQYWSASGWSRNTLDSCTTLNVPTAANGGLGNTLASAVTAKLGGISSGPVALSSGDARLVLSAPAAGASGLVDIFASGLINAVANSCPTLPTSGTAAWLPPSACFVRACYGVCGPRSPVIYFRERF